MGTCRYCRESDQRSVMLNYSTRANAHAECVLKRCETGSLNFGQFIRKVSNLSDFPILMIKDEVPKLEALRDAFRARDYNEGYISICEDMIEQRLEELVDANRKSDRWSE